MRGHAETMLDCRQHCVSNHVATMPPVVATQFQGERAPQWLAVVSAEHKFIGTPAPAALRHRYFALVPAMRSWCSGPALQLQSMYARDAVDAFDVDRDRSPDALARAATRQTCR